MKILKLVILMVTLGIPLINFAQWNQNLSANDRWGKTVDPNGSQLDIRRIGVGNFLLNDYGGPRAALHVNENLLTDLDPIVASNYYTPGHLFRTDGPANQDNMWQMFTGPDATATEKARLFVPANTNDFVVQASEPFGTIRFRLGDIQRMILRDGLWQVHVGIGNHFSDPQHMIHVHTTPFMVGSLPPDAMIGFTHNITGATATDGFLVGINSEGVAELRQQEDLDIRIYSGAGINIHSRLMIKGEEGITQGFVGIGQDFNDPVSLLSIDGTNDNTGEVFKTNSVIGANTFWRMWRFDKPIGNIFSRHGDPFDIDVDNFSIQADVKDITFHTLPVDIYNDDIGEERMRIVGQEHSFEGIDILPGNVGIGTKHPTQKIDVVGNARLQDLPDATWQDETLTKCVVVDDDGVLHWRNFPGGGPGTTLGNECDGPITNPLNVNWEIPLDEYNFVFSGQFPNKTRVGIGIDGCQPSAKLDVLMNTGEFGSTAIQGIVENGDFYQVGVKGFSTVSEPAAIGIGVHGMANYSQINTGVVGIAMNAEPFITESTFNFGGRFIADYGRINVAGFFHAPSLDQSSVHNFGVFAECPPNPDASGLEHNWAGYFVGNVHVDGKITYTVSCTPGSDQQFKQNIVDYNGALGKIRDLRPVNFYFDTVNYKLNFPTDLQYGLIAQEVETVFPELVSNEIIPEKFDTAGNIISESIPYKSLDYLQLTPILVQSVKELDSNLTELVKIPEPPILISPENNDTIYGGGNAVKASSFSGIFTWHSAEEALCYIADYSYSPDMSDLFESQVAFDTVLNMGFPYKNDTVVYWAVRSLGAFGISEYSEIRYFNLHYTYGDDYIKSVSELSDITLKTNVNEIEDALNKTMLLQGVSFEWDIANNPGRNLSEGTNLGLIAQEVQLIFPEVVSSDANGILYIDYSSLIPVLVESVKELKYINDSLSESVNMLESRLNNLEQFVFDNLGEIEAKTTKPADFQQEVVLENKMAIVLNQNVPNPFREQTTISFQIPETVKEAKIVFIDNLGNILKQVEIQERGCGELL
ncbi:MAG TPA: tail fiber domain-containing protein, partial [Bacteroidales bacterium]|nr:tail fiber domain-containing protein [Bacteroidales bacterium]